MTRSRSKLKLSVSLAILLSFVGTPHASTSAKLEPKSYRDLKYPKLRDFQIPIVERVTLDNGMELFLLEDHELPLINVSTLIRTGSVYEPADKIGAARNGQLAVDVHAAALQHCQATY